MKYTPSSTWPIGDQNPFLKQGLDKRPLHFIVCLTYIRLDGHAFIWHALLTCNPWNISYAIRMLYEISLPATKPISFSERSVGRHVFNLWHNTLDMILYPILQRLIGRSSVILVGLSVFGMRQIFVVFSLESTFPMSRNCESNLKGPFL